MPYALYEALTLSAYYSRTFLHTHTHTHTRTRGHTHAHGHTYTHAHGHRWCSPIRGWPSSQLPVALQWSLRPGGEGGRPGSENQWHWRGGRSMEACTHPVLQGQEDHADRLPRQVRQTGFCLSIHCAYTQALLHSRTHIHAHIYTHTHTHTCTLPHTHWCTHTHAHSYTHTHTHTLTLTCIYMHTHTHTRTHTHTLTHTYAHAHTYTHIHVHTHVRTYVVASFPINFTPACMLQSYSSYKGEHSYVSAVHPHWPLHYIQGNTITWQWIALPYW